MAYLSKAYTWILLSPAVLPLFYVDGLMYPLMAPKTLALRAFGIIAIALFSYLALSGQSFFWERLKRWYVWIPAALLAVAYFASIQGIDFYHSFWSTFERGDGLLTLTVCVSYFYLIILSADEVFTRRLLHLVAWVGSIAGFYVLIQWLNITTGADLSFIAKANGRVGGTMGNAAFLAAYLGMTFFVTLAVCPDYDGWKRKLLYCGAGLQIIGILLAATRGTLLAIILIGLLVLIHEAMRGSGVRLLRARQALGAVTLIVTLFFIFRAPLSHLPIESVRRIASISLSDGTVSSRLFLWEHLLPEALTHPIFGVGAEHISTLFNRVYDPIGIVEEWFDRSHNAYLDYFIQFGIVGLALYLALIGVAGFTCWRRARTTGADDPWHHYAPLLFLGFAVYTIQNFFVFDTGVTLWLLFALSALILAREGNAKLSSLPLPPAATGVGVGVGVAVSLLIIPVSIMPLQANRLAFEAYRYQVFDVSKANAATANGLALNTYADLEFGYNAYFEYTNEQLPYFTATGQKEKLDIAYTTALNVLSQNFERYAYDARTAVYLAHIMDSAPEGVAVDIELERTVLMQAIALSPKRVQPWYILANLSIGEAKNLPTGEEKSALYKIALDTLRAYVILVPHLSEPHFVLAELYTALGDVTSAATEAALGRSLYVPDLLTAKRAVVYYEKTLDLPNAKFFLEELLKFEPGNEAARSDLEMINAHEQSKQ